MPDLPDAKIENTEDCSSNDDILAVVSSLDADLRFLAPRIHVLSIDPEVLFISPPTFLLTYLPNQALKDEQFSTDSTSIIEASDNVPAVEVPLTACVQFLADDSNEDQYELPTAYSIPFDCSPLCRAPINLNTAPTLLIQSIAANITTILKFPNPQQLFDNESVPDFAMV